MMDKEIEFTKILCLQSMINMHTSATWDDLHLFPLRLFRDGELQALGGVDLVHRLLHADIRIDISDESLKDLVAVFTHRLLECIFDSQGEFLLRLKDSVEFQRWELGTHNVVDVGGYLLLRVCQGVEGLVYLFSDYLILNAHDCLQKDVVFRLRLDADVELLDTF
jgi:hypothetical protein